MSDFVICLLDADLLDGEEKRTERGELREAASISFSIEVFLRGGLLLTIMPSWFGTLVSPIVAP